MVHKQNVKKENQFYFSERRYRFRRSQSDVRESLQRRRSHSRRLLLLLLDRPNHVRRLRHLRII